MQQQKLVEMFSFQLMMIFVTTIHMPNARARKDDCEHVINTIHIIRMQIASRQGNKNHAHATQFS